MQSKVVSTFAEWCIVELFGHRRLAGYLTEQQVAGVGLLRLDVPDMDGTIVATQYYHPNALYCITPVSEELARRVANQDRPAPVTQWELPAAKVRQQADPDDLDEF